MSARFIHSGGSIRSDIGPLTLAQARSLARFYAREAHLLTQSAWARACAGRAAGLARAALAAAQWRHAAGWDDPDRADGPRTSSRR